MLYSFFAYSFGLVQIEDLDFRLRSPTSTPCRFVQSGPLRTKVYVFEEISMRAFQKYILLICCDVCEKSYDRLKTIDFSENLVPIYRFWQKILKMCSKMNCPPTPKIDFFMIEVIGIA